MSETNSATGSSTSLNQQKRQSTACLDWLQIGFSTLEVEQQKWVTLAFSDQLDLSMDDSSSSGGSQPSSPNVVRKGSDDKNIFSLNSDSKKSTRRLRKSKSSRQEFNDEEERQMSRNGPVPRWSLRY